MLPARLGDRQAGADRRRHRLFDQIDLARAGGQRRVTHGALLDLGDARGDADDDARLHQRAAVVHPRDEVAQHRLGDLEVGDDAVLHGPHRDDVARRAAQHLLGFLAHGEDLLGPVAGPLHGHDGRLVRDDPLAADERQRVRRAEVDGEIVREESVDPVEKHACCRKVERFWGVVMLDAAGAFTTTAQSSRQKRPCRGAFGDSASYIFAPPESRHRRVPVACPPTRCPSPNESRNRTGADAGSGSRW